LRGHQEGKGIDPAHPPDSHTHLHTLTHRALGELGGDREGEEGLEFGDHPFRNNDTGGDLNGDLNERGDNGRLGGGR